MKTYGFTISDKNGYGFTRWFNDSEIIKADNSQGKLQIPLKSIYIAQHNLSFKQAVTYCQSASGEHGLEFKLLTEQDWGSTENPVGKFFKKIFNHKKWKNKK